MNAVFTPDDEPYLGRQLLYHFDEIIGSALEQNATVAEGLNPEGLTDLQVMASIVIPQSMSLMLSIRELIRQGYLFGSMVLVRPFFERVIILLYLYHYPKDIQRWNRGWRRGDAPSLSKMVERINKKNKHPVQFKGFEVTAFMNSVAHGKPDSAYINMVLSDGKAVYASSKILNNPKLCDDIYADVIPLVFVVQGMMRHYFSISGSHGYGAGTEMFQTAGVRSLTGWGRRT